MSDVSIAQEFYKIRNTWKTIDKHQWDMVIWVCEYSDIDIIDKFMEIEASPIGIFDDIFFRIQPLYTDDITFENEIWNEFLKWFEIPDKSEFDIIGALKKDGYLDTEYQVNDQLSPTFENVINELIRLKKLLKFDDKNFILYFPPGVHQAGFDQWFNEKLNKELPKGIRLATIDPIGGRSFEKLKRHKNATVIELSVELNMAAAMKNAMDKDSNQNRPHTPTAKFQKQIRKVMDATIDKEISIKKETEILIQLGYQLNILTSKATAHLVSGIAFFSRKEDEEALAQVNKAIEITEVETETVFEAYPIWRAAMMLKAALELSRKKKDSALHCYQDVGEKAAKQGDVFYAMEAYRMKAYIYFQSRKLKEAWEAVIYSLQAGTNLPLEIRRSSTFLYSAAMAHQIVKDNGSNDEFIIALENRFEEQIGKDWNSLVQGTETIDMKYMSRKNWLNLNKLLEWA